MKKKQVRLTESDLTQIVKESVNKILSEDESIEAKKERLEKEKRFLPELRKTYNALYREYERWQYARYKPQGMDERIDLIIAAMHSVKDLIDDINDTGFGPYEGEPYHFGY